MLRTTPKKKLFGGEPDTPPSSARPDRSPPTSKRFFKKYEAMVISLSTVPSESISGAPDIGLAYVNVPGVLLKEVSRMGEHMNAHKILELSTAAAGGFDGVLVDSIFDTGVEIAREVLEVPVVGLFWPAVSQALLLGGPGGRFAFLYVYEGAARSCRGEERLLLERAVQYGMERHLKAMDFVAREALPAKEEDVVLALAERVERLGQTNDDVSAVIVVGIHVQAELQRTLAAKGEKLAVVDASLCGLQALEGMMRQGLKASRIHYRKVSNVTL